MCNDVTAIERSDVIPHDTKFFNPEQSPTRYSVAASFPQSRVAGAVVRMQFHASDDEPARRLKQQRWRSGSIRFESS